MYIVFGDNIIDSKEIKEIIEKNTQFKIVKDMSKGSKREDVLAYNISINVEILNGEMQKEQNNIKLTEDELFEEYLAISEEMATCVEEYIPKEAIFDIKAYKWDPSDNDIKLVILIAHEEFGKLKLRDVMKRLLKQVE